MLQEQFRDVIPSEHGSDLEWCHIPLSSRVHVCSVFQQKPHDLDMPRFRRQIQGSAVVRGSGIQICPVIDEEPSDLEMPVFGRKV